MKTRLLSGLAVGGWLVSSLALAQTYNAGIGSGTAGTSNVFIGSYSGSFAGGYNNSYVGYATGQTTTGYNNSFLGTDAGNGNTTGSDNCYIGAFSALSNGAGSGNSYVGSNAGRFAQGGYNSLMGFHAGYYATGSYNVYIGSEAGGGNDGFTPNSAADNVMVGYRAGFSNTTGKHNAYLGSQAGYATTTGYDNLFFGYLAGNRNTTGYANAFVGAYAGQNSTSGYSNTCFGSTAGNALTTAAKNSFFGNFAGQHTTYGSENVFLGRSAGATNINGFFNSSIGNYSGPSIANLQNATAVGYRASVSASNSLVLGSINGVNGATSDTRVGIKTTAPAYHLHVNGTAAKPGGGSWTVASDERLKQDISAFTDGLEVVKQIKPVWFRYNGKAGLPTQQKYVGVIAQQMQKVAPYTIGEFTYTDTTGRQEQYLDYDANAVTYLLVNSVKAQQEQIKEQGGQMAALKQENADLKTRLAQLEAVVHQLAGEPAGATTVAQLYQNEPNPTDGSTLIRYFLPLETASAQLAIYSVSGAEVQRIELTRKGNGQVKLPVGKLAAGAYVYHLLVDGRSIASKKLLVEK